MSDQLQIRSPQDRVITEYLCEHDSIADCAVQLQQTGDETLELHRFVMSIIDGQISVQDGISIGALQDMALTVGDGLGPLGEYFCELATATWAYADACRLAGEATKHLFDRQSHLSNALAMLVDERELTEGWQTSVRNLGDDELVQSEMYMTPYAVLLEDGSLHPPTTAITLTGLPKEEAARKIESHLVAVQTLHDSVHTRQDEQLAAWDTAVDDWLAGADVFVQALDGILGVLADTRAEDDYQRLGTVGDVAGDVGFVADVITLIPFPPLQAVAVVVGLLATGMEFAANGGQGLKANYQPGEDSIRVVEGQVVGEGRDTAVSASGFVPIGDLVRRLVPLTRAEKKATEVAEVGTDATHQGADATSQPGQGSREAAPPVDVGVSTAPIDEWQEEADASNPDAPSTTWRPMPSSQERAADIPGYEPPVQIPTAQQPTAPTDEAPPIEVTAPERQPVETRTEQGSTVRTGDRRPVADD